MSDLLFVRAAVLACAAWLLCAALPAAAQPAAPQAVTAQYLIAPGDVLRITVYQSPDLTTETRVAEDGSISYPLIGTVAVGGSSLEAAEQHIAKMLRDGGFLVAPHVTITMLQARGSQISVLGMVARPGRFALDANDSRVTDMIALAGGISPTGADYVVLTGMRNGKPIRQEISLLDIVANGDTAQNVRLQPGDVLFSPRAPTFYIYGEVQRPGSYRLEHNMTVMQALASGGGLTPRGTQRGLAIHRHGKDGAIVVVEPKLDDPVASDDVVYVRESIF